MAKFQVFFALLAVSAALAAPAEQVATSEDQKTEEGAAVLYSAPYYTGYHDSKIVSPYTYDAAPYAYNANPYAYNAVPAVVHAPYGAAHAVQPYAKYAPSVQVVAAPNRYVYAPTPYQYAAAVAQPSAYTYSKAYGGW